MARFRSELNIPIKKDDMDFKDRQMKVWENMETKMDNRKVEWNQDFDKMRDEFFMLKPGLPADRRASTIGLDKIGALRTVYEEDSEGHQRFKVRFDVSEFRPEEIQVKVQENKVIVYARHEERNLKTSVSREYSRQVDIPPNVDQDRLQCLLSRDGILTVEGPVFTNQLCIPQVLPIQTTVVQHNQPERILQLATPVKNPIITEPDGTRKLRLTVDAGEFKPEEIVVKTMEKKLVVHAERVEKTAGKTLHKEFNKEYELPDSVDQTAITAYIGDEGKLIVEAPIKDTPRKYSITQSQDVRKVVVSKESTVTINDAQNRPVITINVHHR